MPASPSFNRLARPNATTLLETFGVCYSPERSAVQAATIQSDPPPQRWHGGEEAAFSKNWTGATSHLKREASEPGTEKNKKKNDEAALEFACM